MRVKNIKRVTPDGYPARVFLAFLASAGLFYVNIMPAIINGLVEGLGFSIQQAGYAASANVYGAAAGALCIVFLINRVNWRQTAYLLLSLLVFADLVSMLLSQPTEMVVIRFLHGLFGGALVGIGFSVIARTSQADKTFGILLVVQFGLGGLGVLYLPRLVPAFGVDVLFQSLIAFSVVTMMMVPFLPNYSTKNSELSSSLRLSKSTIKPTILSLIAIFLFQASNMALFAYAIGLGEAANLSLDFITLTLAASGWVGIAGAVFVVLLGIRYGRSKPVMVALSLTAGGFWALHYSFNGNIFFWANCVLGITWAFILPYLFGVLAEIDKSGRMVAMGGFSSKMGLASGPLVAGMLIGESGSYGLLINTSLIVLIVSFLVMFYPLFRQDQLASK